MYKFYAKVRPNNEGNYIEVELVASSTDQLKKIIKGMYGQKSEVVNTRIIESVQR